MMLVLPKKQTKNRVNLIQFRTHPLLNFPLILLLLSYSCREQMQLILQEFERSLHSLAARV